MIEKLTVKQIESLKGRKPRLMRVVTDDKGYIGDNMFHKPDINDSIDYSKLDNHSVYYTLGRPSKIYALYKERLYSVGDWGMYATSPIFATLFKKVMKKQMTSMKMFEFLDL